ncbi:hypothetical protein [Flavobacterium aquidurense]|uniref:hypothetical protein n=1 Tax=Flavobacterium aquidurense TaxID=362413 RepID=UPI00285B2B9D|nr:hypothetical protein [Flavobacterium aquidurense]MDR7371878.1 hypothetical protein [Flavobacterium aquidurense]
MRQNFTKIARFSLCFILALVSCEDENYSTKNETLIQDNKITEAQKWFNKSNPELTVLKETKKIDWDHAIVTDGLKGKVVEVPIILNDNIAVKNDDKSITMYNRLMFIQDEKESYKLSHVLIGTKKNTFDNNDKDFNFYKIKDDFEGSITILNAKNEITYNHDVAKKSSSLVSKIKIDEHGCLALCLMYSDGSYDILFIISCTGSETANNGSGTGDIYGGDGSGSVASNWQLQGYINQSDPAAFAIDFMEQFQGQKNQVMAKTSFYLMPWCGIDVFVVQNKNPGKPFTIDAVTTDTWGLTLGYTWTQDAFTQNTTGNRTVLTITGTLTYNTGIEGVGNVFSSNITYTVIINNTYGNIQSGTRN